MPISEKEGTIISIILCGTSQLAHLQHVQSWLLGLMGDLLVFQILCNSLSLKLFLKCFLLLLSQGFVLPGLCHIHEFFVRVFRGTPYSLLQLNLSLPLL